MCLMAPGRITEIHGSEATVEIAGRRRLVSILIEPDVGVGEWVIVAGSLIIRRLDADAAGEISAAVALASAAPPSETLEPMGAPR